jgi:hypothetical protein
VNNISPKNVSQAELDTCIEKLSKLYINSAKTTFGTKRSRNIKEKKSKVSVSEKPWLGINSKFVRQNHSQRKSRHKSKKSQMKKTEKENKRVLDASIVNHMNEMRQKMKELRWNNSK